VIGQDADHVGVFLKWRCMDGQAVSVKVNYSLTLVHRHDYRYSRHFRTTQRFTASQVTSPCCPPLSRVDYMPVCDQLILRKKFVNMMPPDVRF